MSSPTLIETLQQAIWLQRMLVKPAPGTHKGPSTAPPCPVPLHAALPLLRSSARHTFAWWWGRNRNVVARGGDAGRRGPCGCQVGLMGQIIPSSYLFNEHIRYNRYYICMLHQGDPNV